MIKKTPWLKIVRYFYVLPYGCLLAGWFISGFGVLVAICGVEAYVQTRAARAQSERVKAHLDDWDAEAELGNDYPWDEETALVGE